jgi:anti-sigma factor RsiW
MPSCDQIARELSDALDGDVPFWRLMQIRMHLALCRRCQRLNESLERTVESLRGLADLPPEPGTADCTGSSEPEPGAEDPDWGGSGAPPA